MNIVIVPNSLSDAINAKLDAAYNVYPEGAIDRELHYHVLLDHFDEFGEIPEFDLVKRTKEIERG